MLARPAGGRSHSQSCRRGAAFEFCVRRGGLERGRNNEAYDPDAYLYARRTSGRSAGGRDGRKLALWLGPGGALVRIAPAAARPPIGSRERTGPTPAEALAAAGAPGRRDQHRTVLGWGREVAGARDSEPELPVTVSLRVPPPPGRRRQRAELSKVTQVDPDIRSTAPARSNRPRQRCAQACGPRAPAGAVAQPGSVELVAPP